MAQVGGVAAPVVQALGEPSPGRGQTGFIAQIALAGLQAIGHHAVVGTSGVPQPHFGAGFGDGDCIRINAALPHSLVREAMDRLEKYVFVG